MTYWAAMALKPALEPYWLLTKCDGERNLVGCSMTFMSSVCLLWVTASKLTSHILLIRGSERRICHLRHLTSTHSPRSSLISGLHVHTQAHIDSHFLHAIGVVTGNPYGWQMSALKFDRGENRMHEVRRRRKEERAQGEELERRSCLLYMLVCMTVCTCVPAMEWRASGDIMMNALKSLL